MGWFKVANTRLVLSDASMDSCERCLNSVARELESKNIELTPGEFLNCLRASILRQEWAGMEEFDKYTAVAVSAGNNELNRQPAEIIDFLSKGLREMDADYLEHMERHVSPLEALATFTLSLSNRKSLFGGDGRLELILENIKKGAGRPD